MVLDGMVSVELPTLLEAVSKHVEIVHPTKRMVEHAKRLIFSDKIKYVKFDTKMINGI